MTSTFKQTDITRAVKAVRAAGQDVGAVEVTQDGTIRILPPAPNEQTDVDRYFAQSPD